MVSVGTVSQISNQESQTIADYENINCWEQQKTQNPPFLYGGFSTNLAHKTAEFWNFGFCLILFNFIQASTF